MKFFLVLLFSIPVFAQYNNSVVKATQLGTWNIDSVINPISVTMSSPPVGGSTSLLQTAGNASLSSIDTKLTAPLSTSRTWALSSSTDSTTIVGAVSISNTPTVNLGTIGAASTALLQTTGNTSLDSIDSKTPSLGQALNTTSVPVVLTATQIATLTPLSTVASTQSGTWITKTYQPSTYGTSITAFTPIPSATDIFTITGSATKTIKIKHISLNATQTTAGVIGILLIKRSTANSGGTSTILTNVSYDSLNPASTATVRTYSTNPTLGTAVGTIHSEKLFISTTTNQPDELTFNYVTTSNMQEISLRGTGEVLSINLNTTTVAGGSFNIDITWTEE
jgi:hypothetical protein